MSRTAHGDQRGVFLAGGEAVRPFGGDVLVLSQVPLSTLLPRSAAIIHHGGTGTTGGAVAQDDGRGGNETPLWLPQQRTIVFADALTERGGDLRVWSSLWHEERALPALRDLLGLPFERVIISHAEPVHTRAAFERALTLPPWPCTPLHIAAWSGSLDVARRLVEQGADVNARDEDHHMTPLEWARNAGQEALIAYLASVGERN